MVWPSGGLQHSDGAGNLVFASHLNTKAMQERGNKVISGCIVTEQSPTPDLTVEVASGNIIANGIVVAVSASDPFAGTPATFATTQGLLTSGQAEFVAVHVDSSGVITNSEGGAASAGQQTPPEVPEDEVLLAMITLTEGDTTINTATDIEDWRQFVPDGQYIAGNGEITGNLDISGHDLATIGLKLAGTLITASATELNVMDGILASTTELNIMNGITAFSGVPSNIGGANAAGSSTVIPRLDHVHAHPSGLTSNLHHTKYALTDDLTSGEITQLQNIDTSTISIAQWGVVGGLSSVGSGDIITGGERGALHTKYALTEDLTSGEITQLKNINSVTITNAQWGYLGAFPNPKTERVISPFHHAITNGSSINTSASQLSWVMPSSDDDCEIFWTFHLPDNWSQAKMSLFIKYITTSAYSVLWDVASYGTGTNTNVTGNVLDNDSTKDFTDSSNVMAIKQIDMDDVDIVAGDFVIVYLRSDALNGAAMQLFDIWIEETP